MTMMMIVGSSSGSRAAAQVALAAMMMALLVLVVSADDTQHCGRDFNGTLCSDCLCCSSFGFCGTGDDYCGVGRCQSKCNGCDGDDVFSMVSRTLFDQMLPHRNDDICPAKGFYTYDAFITAATAFPGFGTTGDLDTRKREIAAFLAQTSHETTFLEPAGYTWGYCIKEDLNPNFDFCDLDNALWACVPGKQYYGRGPMKLSWNYNYGAAGNHPAINASLLADPDLVATNVLISFETAIWYWMTSHTLLKPSPHDVITGQWEPTQADLDAGREPGFGAITNLINGAVECGLGKESQQTLDRIGYYKRYCDMLGVSYGDNLECGNQKPFTGTTTIALPSAAAAAAK